MTLTIGCHLSSSKGFLAMGKTAKKIGANTFAYFTRNPRGSKVKALDLEDIEAYLDFAKQEQIGPLVAHAPYTLNPASDKEHVREFARMAMKEDLERLEYLPGNYYNFHPGSHVGQGEDTGLEKIIELLNEVMWQDMKTVVLLETMAGVGSQLGKNFEELARIIDGCHYPEKIGVCLDSCHVHDGGYDVEDPEALLTEFDRVIGKEKLFALHLNDSKNVMGAAKDRHEKIGEGQLGVDVFSAWVNHPYLQSLPMILETPNELQGYAEEIALLKSLVKS